MQLKRAVVMMAVGGACAAWLAAAATSGRRVPSAAPAASAAPIDARGALLEAEIARLRERLQPPAAQRASARNPFAFAVRHPVAAPRSTHPAAVAAAAPAAPVDSGLKLDGIAEDAGVDGPVRTAIISSPSDLFVVKEGEPVAGRYRVTKISADVVELADTLAGGSIRLPLR